MHVHAHRDSFTDVMTRTGRSTAKGKSRSRSRQIQRVRDLHFPLGGHRFRPCLEDVLQILITEFGVDHPPDALSALAEGRVEWRRQQARAAVRDCPADAAMVLSELGYQIAPPAGGEPADRRERLSVM